MVGVGPVVVAYLGLAASLVVPGFRPSVGLLQRSYAALIADLVGADPCPDCPSDHPSVASGVVVAAGSAG